MRTQIPFRLVGGAQPLIVVRARFNDSEPIDCALDTGASHPMLLPDLGERFGLKHEETREARGAGGPVRVAIGRADSIALGEAVVRDVPVLMSTDLLRIGDEIGLRLGGNIGFGFLEGFRLTVDYERHVLTLCTPDEPPDAGTARVELPFTLAHSSKPLIVLPVTVNERPFQFALDTGASTTVISPAVARQCQVESVPMPGMTGGGGVAVASAGVLRTLTIDRVRLSRVRVAVADFLEMLSSAVGTRLDGIIGTNVLRRFRVTIDYPGKLLRLE